MTESRLFEILDAALELDPAERWTFLSRACAGDEGLLREVSTLIEAADRTRGFLRDPLRPLPRSIGRYAVLAELGRGSFGVVYLAMDAHLERRIALKTFPLGGSADDRRRRVLRDEALALASVTQPNVAHVYTFEESIVDFGDGGTEPCAFITMELVEGANLAEVLRSGALPLEQALDVGRQIAAGVGAAHEAGIVHRDLKPQNVRLTAGGWVKVLDFGLAAPVSSTGRAPFQGTPGYMSPEQIDGGAIDPRTDVWSFGSVLYECLTGSPAIPGRSLAGMIEQTRSASIDWTLLDRIDSCGAVSQETRARLTALLHRCLEVRIERRLPDLAEARQALDEELLRLRAAVLVTDGGRVPAQRPGNLPETPGEFIGRERILDEIATALELHRLVTVTGPGGAGKTRTVLELAFRIHSRFPDGVWFGDLAGIEDGARVAEVVAHSLGLRGDAGRDPEAVVLQHLADRQALLVLDNCEHVTDAAAGFAGRLLERCPLLRIVTTTRESLRLPGERILPLEPMSLPDEDALDPSTNESVRLFAARARARDPGFALDPERALQVARICRRLDGLPLAIELAAGQSRALSLAELAARIEQDPRFLVSASRSGAPARHRSLEDLIDWSYRGLEPRERTLLLRLSRFRGSWSLRAAEAICPDPRDRQHTVRGDGKSGAASIEAWEVCATLSSLVEKSLLDADVSRNRVRYRLLETVRDFAARRLSMEQDPSAAQDLEDAFVRFFLHEAAPRPEEPGWTDGGWLARAELEYPNLLAALEIAKRRGRADWIHALARALVRRSAQLGFWRQCLEIADQVRPPREAGDAILEDRAYLLATCAHAAAVLDDFGRADACVAEGLEIASRLANRAALARVESAAGIVEFYRSNFAGADEWQARAEETLRSIGDDAGLASVLADRARIRSVSGRHDEARSYYDESLRLYRNLGDRPGLAHVLANRGRTAHLLGDPESARDLLEEALAIHRETGDAPSIALCLMNLGDLSRSIGRRDRALERYREAMGIRDRAGQKRGLFAVLLDIAATTAEAGEPDRAARIGGGIAEAHRFLGLDPLEFAGARLTELRAVLEPVLGPDAFRAAWESGTRLSLRQLVDLAGASGPGDGRTTGTKISTS